MALIRLCVTLPEETREKLDKLAKKNLRSASNMIAYLVEQAYDDTFP